jgi:AraC-like DNA-binding protein
MSELSRPMANITRLKTIAEFHRTRRLAAPDHPLISIVDYGQVALLPEYRGHKWAFDFYLIALKRNITGKINYGQRSYDFDEGVMFFVAPGQVFGIERGTDAPSPGRSGWMLLIHPDFLWNTPLAATIRQYGYFDYAINEALFVSAREEEAMMGVLRNIEREYHANIDRFSQGIIVSQIGTLLNYAERFHDRQFITRKRGGHQVLEKLEKLCSDYFNDTDLGSKGLPTVMHFAGQLNISPKYLTNMLKALTGQTVQQVIHEKLIEKAKEKLSLTDLSVSEIAYALGFEHPQSFSKLFKNRTALSPVDFRRSFRVN